MRRRNSRSVSSTGICASVGSFVRRSVSSADLSTSSVRIPQKALVYPLEDGQGVLGHKLGVVALGQREWVEPDRAFEVIRSDEDDVVLPRGGDARRTLPPARPWGRGRRRR